MSALAPCDVARAGTGVIGLATIRRRIGLPPGPTRDGSDDET
jgi:hypothetical protein